MVSSRSPNISRKTRTSVCNPVSELVSILGSDEFTAGSAALSRGTSDLTLSISLTSISQPPTSVLAAEIFPLLIHRPMVAFEQPSIRAARPRLTAAMVPLFITVVVAEPCNKSGRARK
jgi:hypothetical protein